MVGGASLAMLGQSRLPNVTVGRNLSGVSCAGRKPQLSPSLPEILSTGGERVGSAVGERVGSTSGEREGSVGGGGASTYVGMSAVSGAGVSGGPGGISEDAESDAADMDGEGCCTRGSTLTMTGSSVATPSTVLRTAMTTTGTLSLCRAT